MDNGELKRKLMAVEWRLRKAEGELLELCRAALPVLQDHKLDNLAREMGAKVFAVDLIQGEMDQIVKADPMAALMAALSGLGEK